jgi:hypothetical protein
MRRGLTLVLSMLLAGCAQLPLTTEDIQARKFETVPGKAVIYVVRDSPDYSAVAAPLSLGDKLKITTYPGTYFRWEVPPGKHRIAGVGVDTGQITVDAQAGRIQFVQQRVNLVGRDTGSSYFEHATEANGRAAVLRSVLLTTP